MKNINFSQLALVLIVLSLPINAYAQESGQPAEEEGVKFALGVDL